MGSGAGDWGTVATERSGLPSGVTGVTGMTGAPAVCLVASWQQGTSARQVSVAWLRPFSRTLGVCTFAFILD